MNSYCKNLETGKIELHFEKSHYMSLPEDKRREIKSNFLFSPRAGGWVSRAKEPNTWRAEKVAKDIGLEFSGEIGEKLSFAEQVQAEQEKAEVRAERMQSRAEKADKESTEAYKRAKSIGDMIPFGQPILVGHHSEGRHRRDIARIDNSMRASVEASKKSDYYLDRAASAEYTASGAKFKSRSYLLNKIDECKVRLRAIERVVKNTEAYSPDSEIYIQTMEKLNSKKSETLEKMEFFKGKLSEIGGGVITAETLKDNHIKYVRVGKANKWWPLARINRDTVTVLNWLDVARFTWKFRFDEITETAEVAPFSILDKEGKEVIATIKFKE